MSASPDQAALRTASNQHLLLSRGQALDAGLSAKQIRHRLTTGRWSEVHSRVYAIDGRAPTAWEARVMAVVLSIPGALAAGRTALRLHGVYGYDGVEEIEVSAALGARTTIPGVRIRQRRTRQREGATARHVPVTTLPWTVIDLAGELETAARLRLLEDAIDAGMSRRAFFVLASQCSLGRAGVRFLAELAKDSGRDRFRSWLEGEAARILAAAGLPQPRFNVVLRDARGRIGEIDIVFPGGVVTCEVDGLRFHMTARQRRRDKEKDRRLALSGRIPLRFDWTDVVLRPQKVVDEVREALLVAGERRLTDDGVRVA